MTRKTLANPTFKTSVFLNCPFDPEYRDLFRPLIFTIRALGFIPRVAFERADSGEARIGKIFELISQSCWGIHDLSRCIAKKKGEYYRMNMPLELGLDMGCRAFGMKAAYSNKRFLILEEQRYRFQQAVSDLAGSDIKAHKGEPEEVVRIVRNWLVQEANASPFSPTQIWYAFNDFMGANYDYLVLKGYSEKDINSQPEHELSIQMGRWLLEHPLVD
jgi:hypothetical protein